jgi:hypothetical protein
MATFKDPIKCFAPIEVVERLLEIRIEFGYSPTVFVPDSMELANLLDALDSTVMLFLQGIKK